MNDSDERDARVIQSIHDIQRELAGLPPVPHTIKSFLLALKRLESSLPALEVSRHPIFPSSANSMTVDEIVEAIGLIGKTSLLFGALCEDLAKLLNKMRLGESNE